jgi:acetylornithine deacetylase/succinyl-diaminopimelate desuccinylase-like protein
MTLAGVAAVLLFVAQPAMASTDMEAELAEMRDLVQGLQQKVDAQEEQLEHQGEMLEDAQAVVQQTQQDQDAMSGLAKFLESLEVDGNVAGSYFWNFNKPAIAFGTSSPGTNITSGLLSVPSRPQQLPARPVLAGAGQAGQ